MDEPLRLAGNVRIDLEAAAGYLVDDYNAFTVKYYDHGGDSLATRVTTDDIGRMVVFAAQLNFEQANLFLGRGNDPVAVSSPADDLALCLARQPEADDQEFFKSEPFQSALDVFYGLMGDRWAVAQTSKLLHLKWPSFFPIVDWCLRSVYGRRSVELRNQLYPDDEERRSPDRIGPEGYWLAVRTGPARAGRATRSSPSHHRHGRADWQERPR